MLSTSAEFSTVYCDPHKGFGIVNKAEIDVFLELSCYFDDPTVRVCACDAMNYSLPGLSIHGILQAKILECP